MIYCPQLRELIIRPALEKLVLYSVEAVELLIFTCAVESKGGTFLKQIKGPALGIYQMEPATYNDIWQNYIRVKSGLRTMMGLHFNAYTMPSEDRMIYDLEFATAMARIHYARIPMPLPMTSDIDGIWQYYKHFYNTNLGASVKDKSIQAYKDFIR